MPLRVIGAGFGRTGTASLKQALEIVGFAPCYHMFEVNKQKQGAQPWLAASRGQPVDWDQVLEGYQAVVDWPACAFYRELHARYPEARVILGVREAESWYQSARETIYPISHAIPRWFFLLHKRARVMHADNSVTEERRVHANFEEDLWEHGSQGFDACLNEAFGTIGIVYVAGSVPDIEYLAGLSNSAK